MKPVIIDPQDVKEGTTWRGFPVDIDPDVTSPLVSVHLHFKRSRHDAEPAVTLSNSNGGIVIDDTASWVVHIPPQILALSAGAWRFDMRFIAQDGTEYIPVEGVLRVLPSYTKVSE